MRESSAMGDLQPIATGMAHASTAATLWAGFLDFLRIAVWPLVVFTALMYFKRTFTYLVLSLREFNIFGAKGELRNVYEVIEEKAQKKYEDRLAAEKREQELHEKERKIQELSDAASQQQSTAEEIRQNARESLGLAQSLLDENEELKKQLANANGEESISLSRRMIDTLAHIKDQSPSVDNFRMFKDKNGLWTMTFDET